MALSRGFSTADTPLGVPAVFTDTTYQQTTAPRPRTPDTQTHAEPGNALFAVIWSGQAISILSSSIVAYAIIFWMSVETRSAEVLALSAIAGMLPRRCWGSSSGSTSTAGTASAR